MTESVRQRLKTGEMRAVGYELLAACFYPPEDALLGILDGAQGTDTPTSVRALCRATPPDLATLARDYARLFLGPFEILASPYGSIYLERGKQILGDSSLNAARCYADERLSVTLKEPPDHVAIELEFMRVLVVREMEAIEDGDEKTLAAYGDKQMSFLETHLGAWIPQFTDMVIQNAETAFYKAAAESTRTFIDEELQRARSGFAAGP